MSMFLSNRRTDVINKLFIVGAALAGCTLAVSAMIIRRSSRREALLQHKEDLRTWEGEGGKAAPSAPHPVPAL